MAYWGILDLLNPPVVREGAASTGSLTVERQVGEGGLRLQPDAALLESKEAFRCCW